MPIPEICDRCSRVATHESCGSSGRVKLCCEHHVEDPDRTPAADHAECVTYSARRLGRDPAEHRAELTARARASFW